MTPERIPRWRSGLVELGYCRVLFTGLGGVGKISGKGSGGVHGEGARGRDDGTGM